MTIPAGLTVSLCIVVVNVALAQSGAAPRRPAPALQSLTHALAGTWSTTYDFAPQSGGTAHTQGRGEEAWRTGPGGFTLMEEEHISTPSGDQYLLALHWWDDKTHALRGMLCNNSGPEACDVSSHANATLNWDGKQLIVDLHFDDHGKKMLWHEVWSDITPASFTQTGDIGEEGSTLMRAITIHGTKVAELPKR